MIDGRRTFGFVFSILKRRQLRIDCGDSEYDFSQKRISVTRIIMAQIGQIGSE